jgi:hypothetical protein
MNLTKRGDQFVGFNWTFIGISVKWILGFYFKYVETGNAQMWGNINYKEGKIMYRHKIIFLMIGVVSAVLVLSGFMEKSFAKGGFSNGGITRGNRTPPMIMPPPMPPGFPYKWVGKDLILRFNESNLEVEHTEPVSEVDHINLPTNKMEVTRFSIPSFGEDMSGCIFSFEKKYNLEKVRKQYRKLNKIGKLYTWSFVKDNIILIMAGIIPEEKARLYETVLYNLNEK